ncbi:hypothetical protein RB195_022302 [Necator americanus]|uniref:Uncharacterized protein n=1 Tax=Necator americanus TaxID=51031 RepID=A0ABR1EF05_NECAM
MTMMRANRALHNQGCQIQSIRNRIKQNISVIDRLNLPKHLYRDAKEFAEYWAIFETLVHKTKELDVMEKILLLKENLRVRAQTAKKDIKLIPENYNWIIKTLQETYCNKSINRSQIMQKLVNMRPANSSADNSSVVFDQIHVLVNQMITAGYDVQNTCDPIWCEAVIAKFPSDIIQPVLISGQAFEQQTIEDLLAQIKKEVAAKSYIENRLGRSINNKVSTPKAKYISQQPLANEWCLFCHKGHHPMLCRTVTEQNSRRKIIEDDNRC